jgi:hypothetical protein
MRHYDRVNYRHLNDSERYRDYDYLGDDGWVGANERVPHGATDANEPPWSTLRGYETGPLLGDDAFDERRGQGREYGRDLGLGYGRENDFTHTFERTESDDYDRRQVYPRPQLNSADTRETMRTRELRDTIRRRGSFLRRIVRGIFFRGASTKPR